MRPGLPLNKSCGGTGTYSKATDGRRTGRKIGWGPSAPDMSGANAAALEGAAISREMWNDYKTNIAPVQLDQMQQAIIMVRNPVNIKPDSQDLIPSMPGFGLGLERLVLFATGMENIRDVIPFPRTPKHAEF